MSSPEPIASAGASARMSRQRRRDTDPEMQLRRALHSQGYRFRVQLPVPGRPRRTMDIAFTRQKVAVFIDGCFWHVCPEHATWPRSNARWWQQKLETNRARDLDTDRCLDADGWTVVRLWEHVEPTTAVDAVVAALAGR